MTQSSTRPENASSHDAALRGDAGSLAVELAFLMPVLMLLLALLFGYGRVAQVSGALEAGTRDGARAASQARSLAEAQDAAEDAVIASMGKAADECAGGSPSVKIRNGLLEPGFPVTVTAACTYPLGDVLPGVPGSTNVSSSFTSPVDPNRSLR